MTSNIGRIIDMTTFHVKDAISLNKFLNGSIDMNRVEKDGLPINLSLKVFRASN